MSADTVASTRGEPGDVPKEAPIADSPRLNEAHAKQISQLFEAEYMNVVQFIAGKFNSSWPEARDIAAEAFALVLQRPNPETVSFLRGYVFRTAQNIALNRLAEVASRQRIIDKSKHEFVSTSPSPERGVTKQQRLQVMKHVIDGMLPSRRMMLKLRIWDELPFSDILVQFAAQGIQVNERTLYRWYADAVEQLRIAIIESEESKETGLRK